MKPPQKYSFGKQRKYLTNASKGIALGTQLEPNLSIPWCCIGRSSL